MMLKYLGMEILYQVKKEYILPSFLLICLGLVFVGCNEEDAFDCFKSNGSIKEKIVSTDSFHTLKAHDGIDIKISKGENYRLKIRAGKNVLPSISYEVKDGELTIKDNNFCNWVREYGKKEVHLFAPEFKTIIQNGYGTIYSGDTLDFKHLSIDGEDGPGNINLIVNTNSIYASTSRYGTITLSGKTNAVNIRYFSNNAIFDGRDLVAQKVKVFHKSNNTFHVNPVRVLEGRIILKGDIVAYNKPATIDLIYEGSGKLIYHDK